MAHTTPKTENLEYPTCDCDPMESIPYLDTSCHIKNGKIITDLYRNPTDKNQYLLTLNCHPIECLDSIPYSLTTREMRFQELKQMLLDREYSPGIIDSAIAKARAIPRQQASEEYLGNKSQLDLFLW